MPPQLCCFLDKDRNCQQECVAFCGKDAEHPACAIVNSISVLGLAVSSHLRAEQSRINHPKSPPAPQVKT